jgi:hypothetical protein
MKVAVRVLEYKTEPHTCSHHEQVFAMMLRSGSFESGPRCSGSRLLAWSNRRSDPAEFSRSDLASAMQTQLNFFDAFS